MRRSDIAIQVITTSGDRLTDRPLSEAGGKGLFTKEIEAALAGRRDRSRRAFDQGRGDAAARRHGAGGLPRARGCARCLHVAEACRASTDLPQGAKLGIVLDPPRRADAAGAARSRDRAVPRQCRHAAAQARSMAWPTPPCWPWPGSTGSACRTRSPPISIRGASCRPRRRAPSALKSARATPARPSWWRALEPCADRNRHHRRARPARRHSTVPAEPRSARLPN